MADFGEDLFEVFEETADDVVELPGETISKGSSETKSK